MSAGSRNHPKGYGQFTSVATAKRLGTNAPDAGGLATVVAVPDGAMFALIQAEAQSIRWVDDTTSTPTAAVGNLLLANNILEYEGVLENFRFIEAIAGAKVNVNYYGL